MGKKFLVLFCIIATVTLLFAACGNGDKDGEENVCQHTFGDTWATDAKNHWHAATCEHGEIKDALAAHEDKDEDAKCDVCDYEVGHDHAFAKKWSYDDSKHWKDATCSHTTVKGEESLHVDEGTDGTCDVCEAHVHNLSVSGFCKFCGNQIKPIDEAVIEMVVTAMNERYKNINAGHLDYEAVSRCKTEDNTTSHVHGVDYLFGTNGTYSKRTSAEEIIEKYITIISAENVIGYTTTKDPDGNLTYAEPSPFVPEDLRGYYYAISSLVDAHGAEAILSALYELSQTEGVASNYTETHDAEANAYSFSFDALLVNITQTTIGQVCNVNYFEVSVEFTYSDNYELTSLNIVCDCYTNDPGTGTSGFYEEDIDLSYDPDTKELVIFEDAWKDTYTISITQTVGVREEIELDDGSQYAPTDFELYLDEELTEKAESITIEAGDINNVIYFDCTPGDAFFSFIKNTFNAAVTDASGNKATGLRAYLQGDNVILIPTAPGSYTLTITASGITKSLEVNVTGTPLGGDEFFDVTATDNNIWSDYYDFEVLTSGYYTFYVSYGLSVYNKADYDKDVGAPYVDYNDTTNYNKTNVHSFTVFLRKGQVFSFYYMAQEKNIPYTIGYSVSLEKPEQ